MAQLVDRRINILREDIASEMKACSEAAAKSLANEQFGTQEEADTQKVYWNDHANDLFKNQKVFSR